jgi:phage head maturation protease
MDLAELSKLIDVDLVKDAADLEPVEGEREFTIFTRDRDGKGGVLKTWKEAGDDGEDQMFVSGIASSTIKDLHGDTMLPSALIDMEKAARNNLTIFGNHSYDVPEDVYGSVVAASINATNEVDANGAPLYDLTFEKIRINRRNDRAVKSWQAMNDGTKLGLSIGAKIPEGGAVRNKKTGALLISHVDLMETSVVGIPANPRSWIDAATKALRTPVQPVVTITEETETETDTIVSVDIELTADDPSINTDAPSQDLDKSDPETDGAVATPDVIAAATDVIERTADEPVDADQAKALLTEAHDHLVLVTNSLIDADAARVVAEQRAVTAEAERDAMKTSTESVIAEVANLIERVGSLPAGRQSSFKSIKHDADQLDLDGMGLAPEVVRMLRSPAQ